MFEVKAYVAEIVPNGLYVVDVDGFITTVADGCGVDVSDWKCDVVVDDGVVTFKSALNSVLEYKYGDCGFDFVCCGVKDGVGCYVVTIDDFVW